MKTYTFSSFSSFLSPARRGRRDRHSACRRDNPWIPLVVVGQHSSCRSDHKNLVVRNKYGVRVRSCCLYIIAHNISSWGILLEAGVYSGLYIYLPPEVIEYCTKKLIVVLLLSSWTTFGKCLCHHCHFYSAYKKKNVLFSFSFFSSLDPQIKPLQRKAIADALAETDAALRIKSRTEEMAERLGAAIRCK